MMFPMPTPDATCRAAERWFLDNGLPSVVTRRARWRGLWPRSAPVLTGCAALMVVELVIYLLVGNDHVDIDREPTPVEWIVLAVLVLTVPFVIVTGWLVSRLRSTRARFVASTVAAAVALVSVAFGGGVTDVARTALSLLIVPLLTATGLGSVLGWATRLAISQFGLVGQLMLRALPVVLLTVLVFFNSPVWLMAASVGRGRLWSALLFLGAIAAVFLVASTLERIRPMLKHPSPPADQTPALAGTPFASMPDPAGADPLKRRERFNVAFVLILSQLVQVLTVAVVTSLIFFVLGLILLNPQLLEAWTRNGTTDGQLLGMTIPVPNALIQVTLFLGALTFMYLSARAVSDGEYRSLFMDPLIDGLRLTLVARNRYRAIIAANHAPEPAADVFGMRYGEVLLVRLSDSGPEATVYNTFPLNDCPAELWSKLDTTAIASQNDAQLALLNGPRYWLMSSIDKVARGAPVKKTFGGIEMLRQATVELSSMNPAPYTVNRVSRNTVFTFDAGRPVFELIDPDGRRWVMQTWSQTVDPALSLDDLPRLASRLNLPTGWTYESHTLTSPLRVDTTTQAAHVTQDDLANSYSLQTS